MPYSERTGRLSRSHSHSSGVGQLSSSGYEGVGSMTRQGIITQSVAVSLAFVLVSHEASLIHANTEGQIVLLPSLS